MKESRVSEPDIGGRMKENLFAITISRQMGSGGSYIGYLAAKKLGFKYVDREILRQAAEHLRTDVGALEYLDETPSGLIETIMRGLSFGTPEVAIAPPLRRPVYSRDLFDVENKIINEIADQYNAVIVGRGGFYALKDRPAAVHVFIHAPQEFRAGRIMRAQNIADIREAQDRIKEADQNRARFLKDMTGLTWADARNYDLSIKSSIVDFAASAEMIMALVAKKKI
jgi:cytidylate kinase